MKINLKTLLITFIMIGSMSSLTHAESLFKGGVYANDYVTPRSLYYSVKARNIGDMVTVEIDETARVQDNVQLDTSKTSELRDGFTTLLNTLLPGKIFNDKFDGYGGSNSVANSAEASRNTSYQNSMAAQVVQILPNGNLVIQGKKTLMNAGERTDLLPSGLIDPRLIDSSGTIRSSQVANLQFAVDGKGTISRSNNEGLINKYSKYLF